MKSYTLLIIIGLSITITFASGCPRKSRNYVKPISDCFSDKDCPPGAKCMNNICIKSYDTGKDKPSVQKHIDFKEFYSSYRLPEGEKNLVIFMKGKNGNPKFRVIMGNIESELRKYKNISVISQDDIASFLNIQTQKMKINADGNMNNKQIGQILSNYNTNIYTEVDINILEGNIVVALKMLDFRDKQVISSARKTYISQVNLESNIDLLIRKLFSNHKSQSDDEEADSAVNDNAEDEG